MDVIKVKANSRTAAVAGAIAGVVREHQRAEVQAIGAGAINQSVKALFLPEVIWRKMALPSFDYPNSWTWILTVKYAQR